MDLARGEHVGLAAETADALEAADERGSRDGFRAIELRLGGTIGQEALHFLGDRRFDVLDRHALLHVGGDAEQSRDLQRRLSGPHRVGDALAIDQPLVQPRRLAATEDLADQAEVFGIVGAVRRRVPVALPARLGHLVVHGLAAAFGARRDPFAGPCERGAGRDVPEELLRLRARGGDVEVAGQHQHGVGRTVIGAEPLADVVERRRVQILHRADRQRPVRVPGGKTGAKDGFWHAAERPVFALPFFVLHDAALFVEPALVDDAEQVAHAVRLEPERQVECRGRDVLEIVGAVEAGRAVHAGRTDEFERPEEFLVVVFRPLEHQVLEQVRKTGAAVRFVLRADVIPEVDRHDRRLAVGVDDHGQAVVEPEFFERDQHVGRAL